VSQLPPRLPIRPVKIGLHQQRATCAFIRPVLHSDKSIAMIAGRASEVAANLVNAWIDLRELPLSIAFSTNPHSGLRLDHGILS